MSLTLRVKDLTSRAVREAIGERGTRVIDTSLAFSDAGQGPTGFVQRALAVASRFGGWLVGSATSLISWGLSQINFGRIWGWMVRTVSRVAVFNWNATDSQIASLQASNTLALFAVWGSATGSTLGWLTGVGVGYGLGLAVPVIGGASLARTIAGATSAEAIDEIQAVLRAALSQTAETAANNLLLEGYKRLRGLLKRTPRDFVERYLGETLAGWMYEHWGVDGAPTLTFAGAIESEIESITSDKVQAFVENAVEEYLDSFIESGFVIAQELDAAYQQYKMQSDRQGQTAARAVTIIPDVNAPHERLYIEGTEQEVKERTAQTITNLRVLGQRDVGEIVGQPIGEYLRAQPHRRKATVIFKSVDGRATTLPDGSVAKRITYTIPDLKRSLTWAELKRAVRPYNWGEFRATANLDNGRQMAVYGATGQEAEDKLKDLLTLSTANIVTLSISQEKDRDFRLRKRLTRVYPYKLKLLVRRFDPDGSSYIDAEGHAYTDINSAIPLWMDEEPPEFTEAIL